MLRGSYDLPAIKILWNEGTVLLSFPISAQSTTDSKLLEDLCKTVLFCSTDRRIKSQMSDGYRISPAVLPFLHVLPTLLPVQILRYDLFLSEADFPESVPGLPEYSPRLHIRSEDNSNILLLLNNHTILLRAPHLCTTVQNLLLWP